MLDSGPGGSVGPVLVGCRIQESTSGVRFGSHVSGIGGDSALIACLRFSSSASSSSASLAVWARRAALRAIVMGSGGAASCPLAHIRHSGATDKGSKSCTHHESVGLD